MPKRRRQEIEDPETEEGQVSEEPAAKKQKLMTLALDTEKEYFDAKEPFDAVIGVDEAGLLRVSVFASVSFPSASVSFQAVALLPVRCAQERSC